jgi:hypothetical protein
MKKEVSVLQTIGLIGVINVVYNIMAVIITSFTGFTYQQDSLVFAYPGILHMERRSWEKIKWF